MEQNPLEQEKNNKISEIRVKTKHDMEELFDISQEEQKKRVDEFISKLEIYQENGLVFDKEKIKKEVIEGLNIKDKEIFISNLMKALEPFIVAKVIQTDIFKKIEVKYIKENRESIIKEDGNIRLSEVLYAGLENKYAHIHLADAYDFMTKENIADFDLEIKKGLINLAKLIEPMKNIENITATSWIVAKSPKRLEKLGFTIIGEISEEERNKYFTNSTQIIHKAYIDRKKFDELYLKKEV